MRQRTLILCGWLLLIAGGLPGCLVLQVDVANPAPNLPRIAVAPFVNLSSERSIDGRRFAEAYYTELQKIPGFQVIPVGVVESAMHDYGLNLDSPADLQKLIEILDVDGLCFGAVTEYNPYYPPRLGLQISWYTNKTPNFLPGLPTNPYARSEEQSLFRAAKKALRLSGKESRQDQPGHPNRSQRAGQGAHSQPDVPCNDDGQPLTQNIRSAEPGPFMALTIRAQNAAASDLAAGFNLKKNPEPPELRQLSPQEQAAWDRTLQEILGVADSDSTTSRSTREIPHVMPMIDHREMIKQTAEITLPPPQLIPPETDTANANRTGLSNSPVNVQSVQTGSSPQANPSPFNLAQPQQSIQPQQPSPPAQSGRAQSGQSTQPQPQVPNQSAAGPGLNGPPAAQPGLALPGENPRPGLPQPQPYMSYTRVFDGADAEFTASLKTFLELSGDQRSGGWTGHMHRSEDFIRFCMHRMILEMLQLHGGESGRRFVITSRKFQ